MILWPLLNEIIVAFATALSIAATMRTIPAIIITALKLRGGIVDLLAARASSTD